MFLRRIMLCLAAVVIAVAMTLPAYAAGEASVKQLTSQPGMQAQPVWSGDGSSVLFIAETPIGFGISQVSASSGSPITTVVAPSSRATCDMWIDVSKDGQIVFASTRESGTSQLLSLAPGAKEPTRINTFAEIAQFPSWSPDGSRLAFSSPDENGVWQSYTMSKDGGSLQRLGAGIQPRWSPDGKQIALARETSIDNWDIYVVNAAGDNPVRITSDKANELEPDWSPDGKWVCYTSVSGPTAIMLTREGSLTKVYPRSDIFMVSAVKPGSASVRLTSSSGQNIHPRWSRDGREIIFASDRGGNLDIWCLKPQAAE